MLFKKRRKIDLTVRKRTPDIIPFKVARPSYGGEPEENADGFVSPVYGNDVIDKTVAPRISQKDVRVYDPYRETPISSKDKDEPFPEFRKISRKKPKGSETEEKTADKEDAKIEASSTQEEKVEEKPTLFVYDDIDEPSDDDRDSEKENTANEDVSSNLFNDLPKDDKKPVTNREIPKTPQKAYRNTNYVLPPLSLLGDPKNESINDQEWNENNIKILNKTLADFKIDGQVQEYTQGPSITRYSIILGSGVSGSRIEGIANDIQRALATVSVRIENPIPGKTFVGIEIPNRKRRTVGLKELITTAEFSKSKDPLLIPVGLDVEGKPIYVSLNSLPHALVAGASGSGKSVFLASVITSLLYKNTPDDVKFFFVDPKKVDLQQFCDIPHLIAPIVSEAKEAVASLKWIVDEIDRRLELFRQTKCVDIKSFHERAVGHPLYRVMPRIVVIIEEAGDFLMSGGTEAEDLIIRITQIARATGIHVILAMQKPVAKQLSTSIKTNAGGRFAFRVPQQTDSQVILDMGGAEKLLGNGDMIFSYQGGSGRYQAAFLSPDEIFNICNYCSEQAEAKYDFIPKDLIKKTYGRTTEEIDSYFEDVLRYIVREKKCSMNAICQEFGIGFNRANALVDSLERYGAVGQNVGTKSREVLIKEEDIDDFIRKIIG